MKTAKLSALVALLLISAGIPLHAKETHAQSAAAAYRWHLKESARAQSTLPESARRPQDVYYYDGRYIGTDPDPFIRLQLLRAGPGGLY
jgi:hypothetical protein